MPGGASAYGDGVNSVRRTLERHGRWLVPAAVLTGVVVAVTGWWLLAVYSAMNLTGTVLFLDAVSPRTKRGRLQHRWLPVLAMILVPVGIFGVLSQGSVGPTGRLHGDPTTRDSMARANRPSSGPGGISGAG